MEVLLFWVGGLVALAAVTLAVSAFVQWRTSSKLRPYDELTTAIREVALQVSDLSDHIERKETRERVRRLRDSREDAKHNAVSSGDTEPAPGTPEHKAWLRRKMRMIKPS